jgi:hypothetical protein
MSEIFENEENAYRMDDIPKEKRTLNTVSYDYSVEYIYDLIQKGKIVLEVPFQRKQIWKTDKASSLVESIIMNVPIPPLYFSEEDDGKWLVLDGLQRLSSIKDFYNNSFALNKLEVLKDLDKCKYSDLNPKSKSLLDDGLFRVIVIRRDSHPDIKYDIFMRLNQGAVTLNYQELRNCLYRGKLNDMAKLLCSENQGFLDILKQKKPHQRYLDVEFVIRYFAFSDNIVKAECGDYVLNNYKSKLVQYLNEYMAGKKDFNDDNVVLYKQRFNETIQKVLSVFSAESAFRDPSGSNPKLYRTIADFVMPSFERLSMDYIRTNRESIIQKYNEFLQLPEIRNSLSKGSSDKNAVNLRIGKWFGLFGDAL